MDCQEKNVKNRKKFAKRGFFFYNIDMEVKQINEYVGSKIKLYRNSLGLTQEELAKKIGVGKTTISNYEVGLRSPKKQQMIKLSEVFDVSIDDFFPTLNFQENTPSIPVTIETTVKVMKKLEEPRQEKVLTFAESELEEQQRENIIDIREFIYNYYDNAVSAGTGEYLADGKPETVTLPVDFDADFVCPISGDSMEPEYHDEDYVFVKLSYDISDGDIGVFILDGDAYIKELRVDEEGAFLHSLNPQYRDKPITAESNFRIVGEVVGRYNEKD